MKKYFITAISTDSGKTLISAIVTNALQADYWKPIQAGVEQTDSDTMRQLLHSDYSMIHPEAYLLKMPASPHAAAKDEGVVIDLNTIQLPDTHGNDLVIEGAGGILVPLNDTDVVADLITHLDAEVILVSNHYLGSINHTLLTAEELKRRNIKVKGIIFNGPDNKETESIILKKTGYTELLHVYPEKKITSEILKAYSVKLFDHWYE
ncbi:dethiobiotin synthase [uncultured Cytophaga sp.]|uniref:dethiobiotin synthase n=1 Tax=uncultured Cytophaga sp. TaxID=160238 RepID=UPI002620F685|nr:dethiobiotin synthase [uncultured Cytophaga sp.]